MSTLDRFRAQVGFPRTIRIGQGGGFVFRDLVFRAHKRRAVLHFSGSGSPPDNAVVRAWNGRSRSECLNACWSLTLADAREKGGLTQVLRRGLTPWRHREEGLDRAHETRRNNRPDVVMKPGHRSFRRSKNGFHFRSVRTAPAGGGETRGQARRTLRDQVSTALGKIRMTTPVGATELELDRAAEFGSVGY